MTTTKKTAIYWIVGVLALIWNGMGVFQYLSMQYMKEEMAAAMTPEQNALMESLPTWYTAVFAIAVFAGILGSILLLLQKKAATPLFLISLLAVLIQMGYWLLGTNAREVMGNQAAFMPVTVIIVAVFLYFFSRKKV